MIRSQLLELEYSKGTRSFETTIIEEASLEDLDNALIDEYISILNPAASDRIEILHARGLVRRVEGKEKITVAGILLFGNRQEVFV